MSAANIGAAPSSQLPANHVPRYTAPASLPVRPIVRPAVPHPQGVADAAVPQRLGKLDVARRQRIVLPHRQDDIHLPERGEARLIMFQPHELRRVLEIDRLVRGAVGETPDVGGGPLIESTRVTSSGWRIAKFSAWYPPNDAPTVISRDEPFNVRVRGSTSSFRNVSYRSCQAARSSREIVSSYQLASSALATQNSCNVPARSCSPSTSGIFRSSTHGNYRAKWETRVPACLRGRR